MPSALSRNDLVIQRVLSDAREEFGDNLVGGLVCGSVATGTSTTDSDIDIWLVIRDLWRQRMRIFVYGQEVDIFVEPLARMDQEFRHGMRDFCVRMFASGKILYDADGTIKQLVETAKGLLSAPKPEINGTKSAMLKYNAVTLLRDAHTSMTDEEQSSLLLVAAVSTMLEYYYCSCRLWTVPQKKILQDLDKHVPVHAKFARSALKFDLSLDKRLIAASELMRLVMGSEVQYEVDQPIASPRISVDELKRDRFGDEDFRLAPRHVNGD